MNAPDFSRNPFSVDYTAGDGAAEDLLTETSGQGPGTGWVTDLVWSDGSQNLPA